MRNLGNRVGLFGGTFDPLHTGHMIIADVVAENEKLDTVMFIPSARPPHKGAKDMMFSADERYRMLSRAIEGNPKFALSDIEMRREGPSYTIDTIRDMRAALPPETDISFIVGMDNLFDIKLWKDPREIVSECRIIAARRICDTTGDIPDWLTGNVKIVDVPLIELSSSDIRRRIREKRSYRYMVPDAVAEEIRIITGHI